MKKTNKTKIYCFCTCGKRQEKKKIIVEKGYTVGSMSYCFSSSNA